MFYTIKPEVRNDDIGDWDDDGNITVADLGNQESEFLIAVHEAVEWFLCKKAGITDEIVTVWDKDHDLGGDDPASPYHQQHSAATRIEKVLALELGRDWETHEREVASPAGSSDGQSAEQSTENQGQKKTSNRQ